MSPEEAMAAARARRDAMNAARKRMQGASAVAQPSRADMSFSGRLKDNFIGVDDGIMSPGEKIGTALNSAGESLTFGLVGDEASAAIESLAPGVSYDDRRDHYRNNQARFREDHPVASFAAEVAPALIPGAAGAKLMAKGASLVGRAGAGAAMGGAAGATHGFMEGESRGGSAATGLAVGALFGAAAPKVIDALSGVPRYVSQALRRSQQRPTVASLKAAKNAAYHAVDRSGETFNASDMAGLYQRVGQKFKDGHYVEETDNASRAVLRVLESRQGKDTTISQLDNIRKNLWKRYAAAKDQPVILDAIGEIDDLIASKAGASDLMQAARAANSRYAKSELIEDAFQKAKDQTGAAGSGGNLVNKYRQAVSSIINNPKKAKFFTSEEVDVMRQFVAGSSSENIRRLIGKMSPDGNGLMLTLHVLGGAATSGATLPAAVIGSAAKSSAERAALRGASHIQDVVSGFAPAVAPVPVLNALHSGAVTGSAIGAQRPVGALQNALAPPQAARR